MTIAEIKKDLSIAHDKAARLKEIFGCLKELSQYCSLDWYMEVQQSAYVLTVLYQEGDYLRFPLPVPLKATGKPIKPYQTRFALQIIKLLSAGGSPMQVPVSTALQPVTKSDGKTLAATPLPQPDKEALKLLNRVFDNAPVKTMSWGIGPMTATRTEKGYTCLRFEVDGFAFRGVVQVVYTGRSASVTLYDDAGLQRHRSGHLPLYKLINWIDRNVEAKGDFRTYRELYG